MTDEETVSLFAALLSVPLPATHPALPYSPQKQKEKTLDALVQWLQNAAQHQPVRVEFEDLHWADPSTLEFLALLIDAVPTARMFLLLTFRPEFTPPWPGQAHMFSLQLNRLPQQQIAAMVERVAGKPLPEEVVQQLLAKSDGVPLYIEEMTKNLVESGLLTEVDGQWTTTGPLPELAIPSSLQDSFAARLDRLAPVREIAQIGAVLGREFPYDLLHAVSQMDDAKLQDGLNQLSQADILFQRGVPPDATYTFKHALLQDAAYTSLLKSQRQQFHAQTAAVFEAQYPETKETQPELLAHHYTEGRLAEQAIPYWQDAGQRAVQRSANVEAINHLTKGLELVQTLPDIPERAQQELTLQIALGPALITIKGWGAPEAESAYTRALTLCREVGDTPQLFAVLLGLQEICAVQGKLTTARELAEQCLSLAQRVQDLTFLLEAYHTLGYTLLYLGELASAQEHWKQSLALYDPQRHRALAFLYGGDDPGVCCFAHEAWALWFLGYPDQAVQSSQKALTLARDELAHPFSLALALDLGALLHQSRRERQATQELAEAAMTLSTDQGFALWLTQATMLQGWALAEQGQGEEGIAQMRRGLTAESAAGSVMFRPVFLALLAEVHGQVGQAEEGLSVLAEALAEVDRTEGRLYEAEVYRLRGELMLQQSRVNLGQVPDKSEVPNTQPPTPNPQSEAEACFHKALDVARHQEAKSLELRTATSLARLWQRQGKTTEARDLLAPVYEWFTEGFDTADLRDAKALLEELS